MARRLESWEAWKLWTEMRGLERARVIGFANALASHYQGGNREERRTPLKWLGLKNYQANALKRAGYLYIEDVEAMQFDELLELHRLGSRGVTEIQAAIERFRANTKEAA